MIIRLGEFRELLGIFQFMLAKKLLNEEGFFHFFVFFFGNKNDLLQVFSDQRLISKLLHLTALGFRMFDTGLSEARKRLSLEGGVIIFFNKI